MSPIRRIGTQRPENGQSPLLRPADGLRSFELPAILFGGTLLLYLLTTSYSLAAGDGASEIDLASRPAGSLRPYHLLQTLLYRSIIGLWSLAGYEGPALVPVHVLNVALGSATVPLFWFLLVRLELSRGIATLGAALWALSSTVWRHSVTADTGMTPMPFVLAAILFLYQGKTSRSPVGVLRIPLGCALFCFAVALSLNIVLVLPALLFLVLQSGGAGRRRLRLLIGVISLAVFGFVPFLAAAVRHGQATPAAFARWIGHHPEAEGLKAGLRSPLQLPRAWAGIGRLMLPKSHGETALKGLLKSDPVRTAVGDWVTLGRNVLFTSLLASLAVRGFWLRRRTLEGVFLGAPILVTTVFCLFWLGSDPQFWLPVYPFLLGLVMIALASLSASRAVLLKYFAATATCILFFTVNHRMDFPTLLTPSGSTDWQVATRAAAALSPGDLVIGPGGAPLDWVNLIAPDLQVLVLTYHIAPSIRGAAFLATLKAVISDHLQEGRSVFMYGLHEPVRPQTLGYWDLLYGKRGIGRHEFRNFVDREFVRTPAHDVADDIDHILPKRGSR